MGAKPVAIVMGSQSDWTTITHAAAVLALSYAKLAKRPGAWRAPDRGDVQATKN